ncbi:MAG: hypothetical protein AB2A00_34545 [Myxococcota bacterium]
MTTGVAARTVATVLLAAALCPLPAWAQAEEPPPLPPPLPDEEMAPEPTPSFPPAPPPTHPRPAPTPTDDEPEARALGLHPASLVGGAAGLWVAALGCLPLSGLACALGTGPVLGYSQGGDTNLLYVGCFGGAGLAAAALLGMAVPVGISVILTSVNDMLLGGRSKLFWVLGAAYAAVWTLGVATALPLIAGILFNTLVVVPWLYERQLARQKARQTGVDSETAAAAGASLLVATLGTGVLTVLALSLVMLAPLALDVITRAPEPELEAETYEVIPPEEGRPRTWRKKRVIRPGEPTTSPQDAVTF